MKIRVVLELEYNPSEVSKKCFNKLVDQFLSDYDLGYLKDEGTILKAEAKDISDS
jgi:hypothetical protein